MALISAASIYTSQNYSSPLGVGVGTSSTVLNYTGFGSTAVAGQLKTNQPLTTVFASGGSSTLVSGRVSISTRSQFRTGLTAGGYSYSSYGAVAGGIIDNKQISTGTNNFTGPQQPIKTNLATASGGVEYPSVGARPVPVPQEWGNRSQLPGALGSLSNFIGDAGNTLQNTFGNNTQNQRELTCSVCGGKILSNFSGRLFFYVNKFLQRFPAIVIPVGTILNYFRERGAIPGTTALKVCGACNNTRKIKDPTDERSKYAQSASIAQNLAPQIAQEEAKLGTASGNGGNLVEIHAGHVYKKIGLAMNSAPSYRVDYDASYRNKGVAEGDPQYSYRLSMGAPSNHVQGLNPPAAPGGSYTLECANKMSIVTGAQGVDITTGGPVTIDGGITRITGPEVSIGGSTGRLLLAGDVVNVEGKSIEMAPSDGHVYTRGTMSCSGNCMVGGHLHSESASIVKLATVGRNDDTKVSSSSNIYGGPAFWGGLNIEGLTAALREMVAFVTTSTTHPVLLKEVGPASFRYPQTLLDNTLNTAYMLKPEEFSQTGWAVIGPGLIPILGNLSPIRIPIYNFPHIHAMPDQPHTHGYRVPDIDYTADSSQQLRGMHAAGVSGHAPLQKKDTSVIDLFLSIWQVVSAVWVTTGKVLLENNYEKL